MDIEGPGTFLVLANFSSGETAGPVTRLISNGCSGTRLVTEDAAVPGALGPGQEPALGSSRSVTSRFTGKLWIVGGLACYRGRDHRSIAARPGAATPNSRSGQPQPGPERRAGLLQGAFGHRQPAAADGLDQITWSDSVWSAYARAKAAIA